MLIPRTFIHRRKIENACRRDINFMWLLAGQKAPDHSTIARFRTGFLADACEDLFYQMVRRLERMGRKYVSENTGGGHPTEPRVPTGCPYKERCSRAKGNKRLYISKSFLEKRQESYENILSEKGILYRMNRSNGFTFFRFLISSLISTRLERFSSLLQVVHVSVNLQAHWIKCRPL